jgi:hypothetical protein
MGGRSKTPFVDRFWAKVERGPVDWLWTGAVRTDGYGVMGRWNDGRTAVLPAHRLAWEMAHGPIPTGVCVLHHCDVKRCVKTEGDERWPDGHLFLGTKRDNTRDMVTKGRHGRWNAKKLACKRGHPFDEANTHIYRGGRVCRTCARAKVRARRLRLLGRVAV